MRQWHHSDVLRRTLLLSVCILTCASMARSQSRLPGPAVNAAGFHVREESLGRMDPTLIAGSFVTSEDRQHAAYGLKRGAKAVVVLDGVPGREYDVIDAASKPNEMGQRESLLHFSPNGRRMAYLARRGDRWFTVVDGVEPAESKPYEDAGYPDFSPDSRQLVFAARRAKQWFLVVKGVEGKAY